VKIIKRNGAEALFDRTRIEAALTAASADVPEDKLTAAEIEQMTSRVEKRCEALGRAVPVEEIQDMVVHELDQTNHYRLARHYTEYRYRYISSPDTPICAGESTDWRKSFRESWNWIHTILRCFSSAEEDGTVSRDCCGKETDFCSCTKDWTTDVSAGRGMKRKRNF